MPWEDYYEKMTLEPRPTLTRALDYFVENPPLVKNALDLGCGNGKNTLTLLQNGWAVHAISSSPLSLVYIGRNIDPALKPKLRLVCKPFEDIDWQPVTLINASYSLPFCAKDEFEDVWQDLVASIRKGGVFAGHFFGENDTWKDLILLTKQEVKKLFVDFDIIFFSEKEEDAKSATGPMKHWHLFEIIAVKNND